MYDERISFLYPNDRYFAHLSIYHFASRWCNGKIVLDAGCGTGYGTNHLIKCGAKKVYGVDASSEAISQGRMNFSRENVEFIVENLTTLSRFEDHSFDLIVASNSLEHVEGIDHFFHAAWRLLKKSGVLIVAVPTALNERAVAAELSNPFHLNIWSPRHWFSTLHLYFNSIRCYTHMLSKQGVTFQPLNTPEETIINEADFSFQEESLSTLSEVPSFTGIFVASDPVAKENLPEKDKPLPLTDFSITRKLQPAWKRFFIYLYY
jgi:ubiquinone/menaquinone biosynthesis C-methylase UbiE